MKTEILKKANELSRLGEFTDIILMTKKFPRTGGLMIIKAADDFNFWMSFSTGKIYADDNNGNWYSFK